MSYYLNSILLRSGTSQLRMSSSISKMLSDAAEEVKKLEKQIAKKNSGKVNNLQNINCNRITKRMNICKDE